MIYRQELDSDKEQVKNLWKLCFEDTEKFVNWFFSERWQPSYGAVAETDGKIVSSMQGWHYTLNIRGKAIPATMMAGVSTHPDYRGCGHMPQTLKVFMQNARERGEYVVFCTPARHETYFKHLHYSATMTGFASYDPNIEYSIPHDVEITDISEEYAPSLLKTYTETMVCYSNSVMRSERDMRLKFRDYASSDAKLMQVINNKKTAAYCVYMQDDSSIFVEEVCANDYSSRDKLLAAVTHLGKNRTQTIKLPPKLIHELPKGFMVKYVPRGVMGVANISELLEKLVGFNDISVKINDHIVVQNNGTYRFDGTNCSLPHDIEIDSGHLLQFLSGFCSMSELVKDGFCCVSKQSVVSELDKRLPKLDCYVVEEY